MAAGIGADMDAGLAARTAQLRRDLDSPPPPPPAAPPGDEEGFDEEDEFARAPIVPPASADEDLGGDDFGVGAALRGHFAPASDDIDALSEETYGEDAEAEEDGEEAYDDDDFLARRRAEQRRQGERDAQTRLKRIVIAGWAVLLLLILSLLYVVTFERAALEKKWPASKVLYSWVAGANEIDRLREGQEGKTLSKPITETEVYVRATLEPPKVEERDGQMALVLKGYVENTGNRAANVPRLQIEITDSGGKVLDTWTFDPPGLVLRRGGKLPFEQTRTPIPIGAAKAEVKVLDGIKSETKAE